MPARHQTIETPQGSFAVLVPNTVVDAGAFYVSYNDHDIGVYGCDTTALVFGQMERFYILKGDHRRQYAPLIPQGFEACVAYFKEHFDQAHRFSTQKALDALGLPQPK